MEVSALQVIGTLALLIVLGGGLYVTVKNPGESADSISYRISRTRSSFILMALSLTLAGLAFYCFLLFWLVPRYTLPSITSWIIIVSFIAQLLVAWLPARPQTLGGKVHSIAGVVIGTAMVACIWILVLFGEDVPRIAYLISLVTAVVTPITYLTLSFGLLRQRSYVLPSEIIMIGTFSLALLALCWRV